INIRKRGTISIYNVTSLYFHATGEKVPFTYLNQLEPGQTEEIHSVHALFSIITTNYE
ncbi:unnamed protein product, partial [Heterotrigona itama]